MSQALQSLAEETRDKKIQKHLVAFDLGMLHLQRSVFAMVVSLAYALEQLGIQRKAAAVSIQLYLTSIYTSLIATVHSRIDTFLMAIATIRVSSAALGSLMSIFALQGLLLFSIAAVASVIMTPIIASYVPEPGLYPLWPSAFAWRPHAACSTERCSSAPLWPTAPRSCGRGAGDDVRRQLCRGESLGL